MSIDTEFVVESKEEDSTDDMLILLDIVKSDFAKLLNQYLKWPHNKGWNFDFSKVTVEQKRSFICWLPEYIFGRLRSSSGG